MARSRSNAKKNWPDNLYQTTSGYYYWRNPTTKKNYGLGRDFKCARNEAVEANAHLEKTKKTRLVDRLTGNANRTMDALLVRYIEDLAKKGLAKTTLKEKKVLIKKVEADFSGRIVSDITTADIDQCLQKYVIAGKNRQAHGYRTFLRQLLDKSIAIGWVTANVVSVSEPIKVIVRRARLSLSAFAEIYQASFSDAPWVSRSMELALITAQRREDISSFKFSNVKDGYLWITQSKTGAKLAIPTDLRLTLPQFNIDWTLSDIVKRCRDHTLSQTMLHYSVAGRGEAGGQVGPDIISKGFLRARNKTGLSWNDKTPPTFHEIRSLAIRVWTELKGPKFAQRLAAHKKAATTDLYRDTRGDWVIIKSG